jgi:arginyl-tRNA synthetase
MTISRIIAGQLHNAVSRLLQRNGIQLSDCLLQLPPANIDCDLTSTCALKAASILKTQPARLAQDICRLISSDSTDSTDELANCLWTPEGYLNFQLKSNTLDRWFASVLSAESRLAWTQTGTVRVSASGIDHRLQLCVQHCRSVLSAARDTRFDVENRLELEPLITGESAEDIIGTIVEKLHPSIFDNLTTSGSNVFGTDTRRLLVIVGLLADDLTLHNADSIATTPSKMISHAHELASAMLRFFETEAIISSHIDTTKLRLALIAVTDRMLTSANGLALS